MSEGAPKPIVGIIMGSASDYPTMEKAGGVLVRFNVPHEFDITSAHRTPDRMRDYAMGARERGLKVIIAGAGKSAHLPGMTAAYTTLPVIGVPIQGEHRDAPMDSLLSIVQMPPGIPVATMAINGAENAGLMAVEMLAITDERLARELNEYRKELREMVEEKARELKERNPGSPADKK